MIPAVANSLWLAACVPELVRFHRATRNVRGEQETLLRRLLTRNANSIFGHAHNFAAIRSIDDYRARVPLRTYEELEPWLLSGAATSEPVRLFEPTGGSSGASKLIPYTASLQREFQRAIRAWIADLLLHDRGLLGGRAYWQVTPPVAQRTSHNGIPIGFDSDAAYVGGWQQRLLERALIVSNDDLPHARDLRLLSVWNPTLLTLLVERLGRPPAELWPELRLISCWTDANAAGPAAQLAKLFPNVRIQGKGLIATEGFVSIPLHAADAPALAIRSHFFEFLPDDDAARPQLAHELERGQRYSVVLTTGGGLYRYRLNDVVEVTGRIHDCPTIRFAGRLHVSDWFGEKLHEAYVAGALRQAFNAFDVVPSFAMLACDPDIPAYVLYIDADGPLTAIADHIETTLRRTFHYDHARRLGQLHAVRPLRVDRGAEHYLIAATAQGRRAGDVKPVALDVQPFATSARRSRTRADRPYGIEARTS